MVVCRPSCVLISPDQILQLPYRVRWQDLKDLFRRAGTVLRADVSLGPDNRSRGYGTVLLATAEDAGRAIDMLNGFCWQTRVLEVRPDRLGASVDEMGSSLAIRGANGHPSGFPSSGNPHDEITSGQDVVGGTGMKTLFVGNVSLSIFLPDFVPSFIDTPPIMDHHVRFEFVQVTFYHYHLCIFLSWPIFYMWCRKCLFAHISSTPASLPYPMAGFEGPVSCSWCCCSSRCYRWARWALPRVRNSQLCHRRWC